MEDLTQQLDTLKQASDVTPSATPPVIGSDSLNNNDDAAQSTSSASLSTAELEAFVQSYVSSAVVFDLRVEGGVDCGDGYWKRHCNCLFAVCTCVTC